MKQFILITLFSTLGVMALVSAAASITTPCNSKCIAQAILK